MGKLSKRFLSLLVAAVMVLSMLPASVFATSAYDVSSMTNEEVVDLCISLSAQGDQDALDAIAADLGSERVAEVEALYAELLAATPVAQAETTATVSAYKQVSYETAVVVDAKYFELIGTAADLEAAVSLISGTGATGGLIEISEGTLVVDDRQDIVMANIIIKGAGQDKTTITGNTTTFNNSTDGCGQLWSEPKTEYKALLGLPRDNLKVMDLTVDGGDCGGMLRSKDFKTVRINAGVAYLENITIKGNRSKTNLMIGTSDTTSVSVVYAKNISVADASAIYGATEIADGSTLAPVDSILGGTVVGSTENLGAGYYQLVYGGVTAYTTIPYAIECYNDGTFADMLASYCTNEGIAEGTSVAQAMTADLTAIRSGDVKLLYGNNCEEMKALASEFRTALSSLSKDTDVDVSDCLTALDAALAFEIWHEFDNTGYCDVCKGQYDVSVSDPVTVPSGVFDSLVTEETDEQTKIALKSTINEIKNSTALDGFDAGLGTNWELVITLDTMAVANSVASSISYDVQPYNEGSKVDTLDAAITFRLPIPASVIKTHAKVYHEGELMDTYPIQGEGNGKYVEVSSAEFSVYTVEPVDAVADLTITTADELAAFAAAVNAGDTFYGKLVVLAADIDLSGIANWTPIGPNGDGIRFEGTFDGQDHTISNMTVKQEAGYHGAGLFGAIGPHATVTNFTIDGANVESISSGSATINGTAVAVGAMPYGGTITDVHVKNATVKGNRYVAGIVGFAAGTITGCTVENVTLTATPDDLTGSYDNGDKVGGIVGCTNSYATVISNCELLGTNTITGYRDIGGIVGHVASTVDSESISTNEVQGTLTINVDRTNYYGDKAENTGAVVGRTDSNASIAAEKETLEAAAKKTATVTFATVTKTYVAYIGEQGYETLKEAMAAANAAGMTEVTIDVVGQVELADLAGFGTLTTVTLNGAEGGSVDCTGGVTVNANGKTVNFNNLTICEDADWSYAAIQSTGATVNYNNCTIEGCLVVYGKVSFTGCTFNQTAEKYALYAYAATELNVTNTTFNVVNRAVKIYSEMKGVTVDANFTSCTFKAQKDDKAAIEITIENVTDGAIIVEADSCEASGFGAAEHNGAAENALWNYEFKGTSSTDETVGCSVTVNDVVEFETFAPVAQVGDVKYATLAEAVAAVKANGGTLTLLAEANESITFNYPAEGAPTEITLDLNGFTITSAESTLWVSDGYSVTVKDSAGNGKIISTNTSGEAIAIARGGKVTLESGYVYNTAYAVYLYSGSATGEETFVMNGGHVVADNDGTAIAVGAGSVDISGGTVEVKKTSGGWAMYIYEDGSATISGGTIVGVPGGDDLTISGGTFKLITDSDVLRNDKLAAACMFKDNGDGTYNVVNLNGYALVGSGTESNPYVLSTKEDLFAFAAQYNSKLIARTVYVELGADIDLNDEEWTPIGDREADQGSFLGVFDGKGYTISNLWISEYTKTGAGFFSKVGNQTEYVSGTVKNVTFNNVTIISDKNYVGVIAQAPLGALIENVHITGDVAIQGYGYVGGIVGHGYPTINDCSVKAEGQIIANYWGAGAILGFSGDNGAKVTNSTVVGTGEEGLEIHGNYGGAASVTGSPYGAAVNGATVSDVNVTSNSDYCMGYVTAGGTLQGEIVVENVTAEANGVAVAPDQIAKIGDVIYTELADAIEAAGVGDTVTVLSDVTLTDAITITDGMDVTISGEGKTITGANGKDVFVVKGGKLTLTEGLNVHAPTDCCIYITGGDVFTAANLTKSGTKYSVIQGNGSKSGNVTITGGTVTNEIPEKCAIYWPQDGKLTITGGTITGGTALRLSSGSLEITGGTFIANGTKNDYVASNGASVADTGDAVMIENIGGTTGYEAITSVVISGGTFKSANASAVASYTAGNEGVEAKTGFISGGTFNTAVAEEYCAEGYVPVENEDGTYGVEEKPEVEVSVAFDEVTLLLKDEVKFKFYLYVNGITGDTIPNAGLEVWSADIYNADNLPAPSAVYTGFVKNGSRYQISTDGISAKNMGDLVYVRAYVEVDGVKVYTNIVSTSPAKYCEWKINQALNDSDNVEKKDEAKLCIALMNYGAAAQEYFAENSDYTYTTLMNSFITDEQQGWIDDSYKNSIATKTVPAYNWTVADSSVISLSELRVVLTGAPQMKLYAAVGATGTVKMYYWTEATAGNELLIENATEMANVGKNGAYYQGYVLGVAAKNMGDTVYMCAAVEVDGVTHYTQVVGLSIHAYADYMISNNMPEAALCETLILYSNIAKEYMATYNPQE